MKNSVFILSSLDILLIILYGYGFYLSSQWVHISYSFNYKIVAYFCPNRSKLSPPECTNGKSGLCWTAYSYLFQKQVLSLGIFSILLFISIILFFGVPFSSIFLILLSLSLSLMCTSVLLQAHRYWGQNRENTVKWLHCFCAQVWLISCVLIKNCALYFVAGFCFWS